MRVLQPHVDQEQTNPMHMSSWCRLQAEHDRLQMHYSLLPAEMGAGRGGGAGGGLTVPLLGGLWGAAAAAAAPAGAAGCCCRFCRASDASIAAIFDRSMSACLALSAWDGPPLLGPAGAAEAAGGWKGPSTHTRAQPCRLPAWQVLGPSSAAEAACGWDVSFNTH